MKESLETGYPNEDVSEDDNEFEYDLDEEEERPPIAPCFIL